MSTTKPAIKAASLTIEQLLQRSAWFPLLDEAARERVLDELPVVHYAMLDLGGREEAPHLHLGEVHRRPVLGRAENPQILGSLVAVEDPALSRLQAELQGRFVDDGCHVGGGRRLR